MKTLVASAPKETLPLVASAPKETLQNLCLKFDEEIQCLLCWCIFPSKIAHWCFKVSDLKMFCLWFLRCGFAPEINSAIAKK